MHPRTRANLATLTEKTQAAAKAFLEKAAAGLAAINANVEVRIISGLRTYAEQDALYAQGRTKPGKVVTNARGGYSNHNSGIAFDIGLFSNGEYLEESPHYRFLGPIGESVGLLWGGRWRKFPDQPHYELRPPWSAGMDDRAFLAECRRRHAAGEPID